uniref:PRO1257 n=3 Tax=Homininae TaxID=207598 RepID=Q9P1K0_HUMAN|nr:PRO1257 [Homo sapiens]
MNINLTYGEGFLCFCKGCELISYIDSCICLKYTAITDNKIINISLWFKLMLFISLTDKS